MEVSIAQKRKFSHVEIETKFLQFPVLHFTNQGDPVVKSSDSASESSSQPSPPKKRNLAISRLPSLTPPSSVDGDEVPHYSERNTLEQLLVRSWYC